jgi:peroxiredoxin
LCAILAAFIAYGRRDWKWGELMNAKRFNWPLLSGFLLSVFAFLSYFFIFVWFPSTRNFPWANFLLFVVAIALLILGLRRQLTETRSKFSKILGFMTASFGVVVCVLFLFGFFVFARMIPASKGAPQVGQKAPEFTLPDQNNKSVSLAELLTSPINGKAPKGVLLVFYRGYWWPSCNSELRGIEKNLSSLALMGIRPVAISVDVPNVSKDLTQKAGYTFTFLSDESVDAIRRYDLVHEGMGENGHDIARPAEFLIDANGIVRWVNLTENYWVRATPEQIIDAAKTVQ